MVIGNVVYGKKRLVGRKVFVHSFYYLLFTIHCSLFTIHFMAAAINERKD